MESLSRFSTYGLVALRLYVGLFWLEKGIRQKMLDRHWVGPNGDCALVVNSMLTTAPGWYRDFLHAVVLPHITLFSTMVQWGETLVGLSLFFGFLSRFGAIGGLFLVTNYFLGNGAGALRDGWFGFDAATFMMTSVHAIVPTGLVGGIDGWLRRRKRALAPAG